VNSSRKLPLVFVLALTVFAGCAGRDRGVPDRFERPRSGEARSGSAAADAPAGTTTVRSVATPVPGKKPRVIARAHAVALATTKTHVYFGDADDGWLFAMPKAGATEPARVARHAPVTNALVADATWLTWIASPGDSVLRMHHGATGEPTTIREREIFTGVAADGADVFLIGAASGGGALTRITGPTAARLATFDSVPRSVMVDASNVFVVTSKSVLRTPRQRGEVTTLATGTAFGAATSDQSCVYVTTQHGSSRAILRVPKYGGAMTSLSGIDGVRDAPIAVHAGEVFFFDEARPALRAHAIDSGKTRVVSEDPVFERVNAIALDDDGVWVATGEASSGAVVRVPLL
jgi:hypothetical protein